MENEYQVTAWIRNGQYLESYQSSCFIVDGSRNSEKTEKLYRMARKKVNHWLTLISRNSPVIIAEQITVWYRCWHGGWVMLTPIKK